MKRILSAGLIIAALFAAAGCNTVHGIGKDVESAGKAIKKTADKSD